MDNMKRCSACGASIPADMRFCIKCGAKQLTAPPSIEKTNICKACGVAMPEGAKFCIACGAGANTPKPVVGTTYDTHTSKSIWFAVIISVLLLLCVVLCVLIFKDRATPSPAPFVHSTPHKETLEAIPLSQLVAYNIEYGLRFYDYAKDNNRNTYDNAIGGAVENTWNSAEYDLSGRYKTISGRVILNYDYRNQTANYTCMRILLDGELVYTSPITTKGMSPADFELNISGADTLCISIYGNSYLRLVDCLLFPAELIDNQMTYYRGNMSGFYPIAPDGAFASSELYSDGVFYDAGSAIDGDYTTSWQENAKGLGLGESITLHYSQEVPVSLVKLRLGFATKQSSYDNNAKPAKLKVEFSDGSVFYPTFAEVNEDVYLELNHPIKTVYMRLTILDAYPGLKYEDTAITEIQCYFCD